MVQVVLFLLFNQESEEFLYETSQSYISDGQRISDQESSLSKMSMEIFNDFSQIFDVVFEIRFVDFVLLLAGSVSWV